LLDANKDDTDGEDDCNSNDDDALDAIDVAVDADTAAWIFVDDTVKLELELDPKINEVRLLLPVVLLLPILLLVQRLRVADAADGDDDADADADDFEKHFTVVVATFFVFFSVSCVCLRELFFAFFDIVVRSIYVF
jgi:hypothetical protein